MYSYKKSRNKVNDAKQGKKLLQARTDLTRGWLKKAKKYL